MTEKDRRWPAEGQRALAKAEDVAVAFNGTPVLEGINLSLLSGELVGLVGPNGAGKTTLLRVLAALIQPTEGRVSWQEADRSLRQDSGGIAPRRTAPAVGYLPQDCTKFQFPVSAWDLVMMGRTRHIGAGRWPASHDAEKVRQALKSVALPEDTWGRNINKLSGGQRRMAMLAMLLASESHLLLLDEPAAALDLSGHDRLYGVLNDLREDGIGIVAVSHDLAAIAAYADRLVALNRRVWASGEPEEVLASEKILKCYGVEAHHQVPGSPGG